MYVLVLCGINVLCRAAGVLNFQIKEKRKEASERVLKFENRELKKSGACWCDRNGKSRSNSKVSDVLLQSK